MSTSRHTAFHIPGEITDHIISLVWPDCSSLCACALVCRDWLPASRLHLFYSLDISSGVKYDHLLTQVIPSKTLKPWLDLVRHLRLCGYLDIKVDYANHGSNGTRRVHRFIHDFAGHLPSLQSLQLVYLDWHLCPPHPSAYLAISRFSLVREVVLNYCEFPSFNVFRRLIVALPSLAELSLKYSSWPATLNTLPPHTYSQKRPVLTKLRVVSVAGADYVDDLLQWLLRTPSRSAIQDLTFMSISRGRHDSWRHCHIAFLQSMSSSLTSLNIPIIDKAGQVLLLAQLTSLTNLGIFVYDRVGKASEWAKLPAMLSDVGPTLRSLSLLISQDLTYASGSQPRERFECLNDEDMELIDPLLDRPVFDNLEEVTIMVKRQVPRPPLSYDLTSLALRYPLSYERIGLSIRSKLPQLCARGVAKLFLNKSFRR